MYVYTCIHMEYYSAIKKKKEWNPTICDKRVVLEGIILSKINQAEEDKYYIYSLICVIWKTNEQI